MARILIVDDAPAVLDVLEDVLSREGHEVIRAGTGSEAVARFEGTRPHLAVVDVLMPDIDGFAVVESIRRLDAKIPVILITGLPGEDLRANLARFEAVAFFEKGSGLDRFVELVTKILGAPGAPAP